MESSNQPTLRERLNGLAPFLPALEDPNFEMGTWSAARSSESGVLTLPSFTLNPTASSFIEAVYNSGWVIGNFDWPAWKATPEATQLRDDPETLAKASPEQIAQLLTVLVRQERFCEGSLESAHKSGLLTSIVRRAVALLSESK